MPPKKSGKRGKWPKRIATGAAVVGIGLMAAGCFPKAKKTEFIMHDLNLPGNKDKAFNYVPQEFQPGGKYALNGSVPKGTGAGKGKARPRPMPTVAKGPSGQWPQIFEIYPRWKADLKLKRYSKNANAAIDLVSKLSRQTRSSSLQVLAVMEKFAVNSHSLKRYKSQNSISSRELKIFDALLEAEKTDRPAFRYLHVKTTRAFGSKKKVLKLLEGK